MYIYFLLTSFLYCINYVFGVKGNWMKLMHKLRIGFSVWILKGRQLRLIDMNSQFRFFFSLFLFISVNVVI